MFDKVKLCAVFGQANNVPAYGSKFALLIISNIQGNPGVVANSQAGQPNIEPEGQEEFETGFDFSLPKGRLGFELTYYNKTIDNFLMQNSLPSSSGFTSDWVKAGNQGVELGLNAKPVSAKNISWVTSVNFWLNRSLVTKPTIPSIPQGSFGYVLGTFQIEQANLPRKYLGLTAQAAQACWATRDRRSR